MKIKLDVLLAYQMVILMHFWLGFVMVSKWDIMKANKKRFVSVREWDMLTANKMVRTSNYCLLLNWDLPRVYKMVEMMTYCLVSMMGPT